MPEPSPQDPTDRLYSTAVAELALERAARLQTLAAAQREQAREQAEQAGPPETQGFARAELLAAARGAGIDPDFLEVALAELDNNPGPLAHRNAREDGATLTRWLGVERRNVMITRSFDASPERVWDALLELFNQPRSGLELVSLEGGHPVEGGVAVFHALRLQQTTTPMGGYSMMAYRLQQLELKSLQVTLRREGEQTRVCIYGDLEPGMRKNASVARWLSVLMGVSFAACAGPIAMGTSVLAGLTAGSLGFLGGGASMFALWGWTYPRALAGFEHEVGTMLDKLGSALTLGAGMPALAESSPLALVGS